MKISLYREFGQCSFLKEFKVKVIFPRFYNSVKYQITKQEMKHPDS